MDFCYPVWSGSQTGSIPDGRISRISPLATSSSQREGRGQSGKILESIDIITNRNYIPKDTSRKASGLRLGTGPIAAWGIAGDEVRRIARIIDGALMAGGDQARLKQLQRDVLVICQRFPVYN